jgi:DNA-binding MarR family transcriptional regulator
MAATRIQRKTRWLSSEEQQAWRSLVFATEWLQQGLDRQMQRDAGMPHAYYALLVALSEAPRQTMALAELAASQDHSLSRLSHAISKMEGLGWVTRKRDATDARVTVAKLTATGAKALRAAAPAHVEFVRSVVIDQINPADLRKLTSICTTIMRAWCWLTADSK